MPPKIARKLTAAETQHAIAQTQGHGSSQDEVHRAVADQETQVDGDIQPDQDTQIDDDTQLDQETQAEDEIQPDADAPTSSADSNSPNEALASTADGASAATPDTPDSSADETETKAAIKTATKKPAGKKVSATEDKKDGEGKKRKRRVKRDPTNFQAYIHKGLSICLLLPLSVCTDV